MDAVIGEPELSNRHGRQTVRILLLEDDPISVEIVGAYLRRVTSAESDFHSTATLSEALALLARAEVDLVIADLHLPDSAGAATIAALVRVVGCPVIAITSDLNPSLRDGTLACGAYDFLHKVDLTEATLSRLVRLAAMQVATFRSLRESEARFRSLSALTSDWFWETDEEHRFVQMPSRVTAITGLSAQTYMGRPRWEVPGLSPLAGDWKAHSDTLARRESFRDLELVQLKPDATRCYLQISGEPVYNAGGSFAGYRGAARDISERKRREEEAAHLARMYEALGAANEAILRAKSPQEIFDRACEIAVGAGGFILGSVFSVEPGTGRLSRAASSGRAAPLVKDVAPLLDDSQPGVGGVLGQVCSTGARVVSNDYATDPMTEGRRKRVKTYPIGSAAAFPLQVDGKVSGVFGLQHAERNAFTPELTGLLQRLADNISFALENFRREARRLEAEAALQQSEAWFRQTFELAGSGMAHVALDGTFLRVNGKLSEILGYTEAELVGRSVKDISHPEDRDVTNAQRARMRAGEEETVKAEKRYLRRDGKTVWAELTVALVRDGRGRPLYEIAILDDITQRKREEALLALEHAVTLCLADAETAAAGVKAVLRSLCESLGWPAGRYFAVDEDAGVLRFSEAWGKPLPGVEEFIARSRRLEYPRGHGLSGKVWQSGEPLWLKDVSKHAGASGSLQGTLQGGAFVFPITSGGRTIGVMSFSSEDVRDPDARLLKAIGVIGSQVGQFLMRKKAERKQRRRAEDLQRFRAAMDMAHDAIYLTERSTMRFLDINRVGCRALGYTREQLLAMGPHDVLTASREELEREYDEVIARGSEGIRTEAAYVRKDGRKGWTELFRRALRSGDGWIIVTISRDITERKTEEGELRRFRAALDAAADPVLLIDARTGAYVDFNEAACHTFGYSRDELLALSEHQIRVDRTRERLLEDYKRLEADPGGDVLEIGACRRKGGSVFPVEFSRRIVETSDGPIVVATARDLTERLRADQRQAAVLKYQERVARFGQSALAQRQPAELIERAVQAVLEALGAEAVAYVEPEPGAAALVSRALVGVADAAAQPGTVPCAPGSPMIDAIHSGARAVVDGARLPFPWARGLRSTALLPVRGENGVRGLLCAGYKTANAFAPEELNFAEAVASVLSTALQRIDSENRLAYLAQFDPLTGLANRTLLADRFSQMIVQAKRHDAPLAVLFIDLDGFKTVNDTLGHAGGDELLKEVAQRLQATVRGGDTVARISGDEFAIVLADLARADDAALVAQKVIDRLAATVDIAGKEVFVTASVGIAAFPGDGADADTLIGAADAAMYRAKQAGRNTFQFFTAEINQRSRARAQTGAELRRALEREEFTLFYQPKVDLATRQATGAEALLRWKHPERGLVSPMEFIPILEETGLIVPVGDWVLRRACEDLKAWQAAGLAVGPVAVNLSARQFRRADLDSHFKALVAAVGIDAGLIELEITESQLMQDPAQAIRVMRALRDAGMRIAIDDFGTGYSSLAYLNRFPVSALKIDRSFVKDMAKDKDAATIVRTIIEMAHSLGFTVVAEGVETEEQATFLQLLRCEQAQGFLFAKPMPAQDYVRLLAKR